MDSSTSALSPLQTRLLGAFRGVEGVWLTGGGALAGFHLGHRGSHDLDWFTADRAKVDELTRRLIGFCHSEGLKVSTVQEFPGFRRLEVQDGAERTLVDLVHEPVTQLVPVEEKLRIDGLRVDPPQEIVANKLAAVLGRGETKDLVDLFALSRAGWVITDYLAAAHAKDGGLDVATLAWVLSTVPVDTSMLLLTEPISADELERFRNDLVAELQVLAFPG